VTPDLVYVVGGPGDREDLRHSLRTLEANLRAPFREVWVVGDPPAWFRGRHLALPPNPEKFRNQRASLTAYVNHPDAAETFVLLNDDMFVIEPTDEWVVSRKGAPLSIWAKVHRDALRNGSHAWDCWQCSIIDTASWTGVELGTDPLIYECHSPLVFDTAKLRDVLARYPLNRRFVVGEVYPIAGAGDIGENRGNAKCKSPASFAGKLANPMPYLSCSPETWAGVVGDYIRPRYPTPSRWEAPVLNVQAITDQKIAVGLVENPCCWALRDLAAEVPADQAIVELGAFKGRTTGWLAMGAQNGPGARVWSVDPWEDGEELPADYQATARTIPDYRLSETRDAYEKHLDETGVRPFVTTVQATAKDAAKTYDGPPVALLWHDAIHTREAVAADLRAWLPHMADNAVVVLHDIGNPAYGVEAGAKAALARRKGWDWDGREMNPWPKQPEKRGFMVVRRHG